LLDNPKTRPENCFFASGGTEGISSQGKGEQSPEIPFSGRQINGHVNVLPLLQWPATIIRKIRNRDTHLGKFFVASICPYSTLKNNVYGSPCISIKNFVLFTSIDPL